MRFSRRDRSSGPISEIVARTGCPVCPNTSQEPNNILQAIGVCGEVNVRKHRRQDVAGFLDEATDESLVGRFVRITLRHVAQKLLLVAPVMNEGRIVQACKKGEELLPDDTFF